MASYYGQRSDWYPELREHHSFTSYHEATDASGLLLAAGARGSSPVMYISIVGPKGGFSINISKRACSLCGS